MEEPEQPIYISALQHYAYCPRQFALIHIKQVWAENYFTAHGNLLHERVDSCEPEQRGNVRFRGLYVFKHSNKLGNAPASELFKTITVKLKDNVDVARSPNDYQLSLEGTNNIENVEFMVKTNYWQ